jgi:hypothetical protein
MNPRAGTWIFGLIGSIAAHMAILAVLSIAIRPDPVTEQPMPTSELEVQAYQLDRTKALEQTPDSQQARADTPEGTALDAGAIPKSRAKATQAVGRRVQPDTAEPTVRTPPPLLRLKPPPPPFAKPRPPWRA